MKVLEVVEKEINLNEGRIVLSVQIADNENEQAHVFINYSWDWNKEETEREVISFWMDTPELFYDGTEVDILAHEIMRLANFTAEVVTKEYIENLIN